MQRQNKNLQKNKNDKNRRPLNHRQANNGDDLWLSGKHPVFSALQNKNRKIHEILATKNSILELENFLTKNSLQKFRPLISQADNQKIETLVGKNQVHQGLAIRCSRLRVKNQNDLLEELYALNEGDARPTLLLCDQISDPHNVGAIIRSAVAFGVKKIIFCEHGAPKENATIVKSSAGTIENAELITVTNFSNLIEKLKKIGYWCVGLDGDGTTSINALRDYKNIALIIGSEGDGIRDLVKKNCDFLARIEIDSGVESLNASVAAALALYSLKLAIS